jgi:hypothetical protein
MSRFETCAKCNIYIDPNMCNILEDCIQYYENNIDDIETYNMDDEHELDSARRFIELYESESPDYDTYKLEYRVSMENIKRMQDLAKYYKFCNDILEYDDETNTEIDTINGKIFTINELIKQIKI